MGTNRTLRRRASGIVLGLALLLGHVAPAQAANGSPDPSLLSRYFPTAGQVTVATDDYSSYAYQWAYWQASSRIANLRDSDGDAYEHEVTLFTDDGCWGNAYDRNSWDSNLPYAYLDIDGNDPVRINRAGGTGRSKFLATGRFYYHWLRVKGKCANGYPYVVKGQDSHRSGPCGAGWQWCVYADNGSPRDIVPFVDSYETGRTYDWWYQRLYNDGFEDGTSGWHLQGQPGTAPKWAVYTSTGALDRSKYLSFRCNGSVGCWIYQNAPAAVTPDDLWTAEVGARCRPANPSATSCAMSLGMSGLGVTTDEHVSRAFSVPNDGKWHVYGYRGSRYTHHNRMRFLISNDGVDNRLDIDLTTLHHSDRFV